MYQVKPIKSEEDYDNALKRMEKLFHAEEDTEDGDEAEILMLVIEDYEEKYHPIGNPDPIEAIKFMMEQKDLKQKDLAEILGVSEPCLRNPIREKETESGNDSQTSRNIEYLL